MRANAVHTNMHMNAVTISVMYGFARGNRMRANMKEISPRPSGLVDVAL